MNRNINFTEKYIPGSTKIREDAAVIAMSIHSYVIQ